MIQDCYTKEIIIKSTHDIHGSINGTIQEIWNVLEPLQTYEVRNVYITECSPGSSKGPHVHDPPKIDRFLCIHGHATVFTRNEQTKRIRTWELSPLSCILIIPPGNSHMIESQEGCLVMNFCSEAYDPSKPYNQKEVTWRD